MFKSIIKNIKYNYKPLIKVLINKESIINNYNFFSNIDENVQIAPVLKSNAYGHDLVIVAKIFDKLKVPFLVVDSYYEAVILRNANIKTDILIIGYTLYENIVNNKLHNILFTISSYEQFVYLINSKLRKKIQLHLKFDTGMNRQGIDISKQSDILNQINLNKKLNISGICSHLADADTQNSEQTRNQIEIWNNIVKKFKNKKIEHFHLAASSGVFYSQDINANIARVGLGIYGIKIGPQIVNLKPVLSMHTIITSVKRINVGDKVGYQGTFMADQDMKIATIPVGYFEGVDLRLTNKGFVKVNDIFCPILGKISMNITVIDVSRVENVKQGTNVQVISEYNDDHNSVTNIARDCNTIPYNILVGIPEKLRREVV